MTSESPSVRSSRLYQILVGKNKRDKYRLFDWEPLLDAFLAFYEICCTPDAQTKDKNISEFVKRHRSAIEEIKGLRIQKGDFDIIKIIGRGHFGEVNLVKERSSGDIYAMKVLSKSATLSQNNVAFYEEERDIMAFANSPWVTSLQYAFQDTENLYLVMEFLPGGDLLTLLERYEEETMSEDDARFYLGEIILAVHAVHVIGYVHRDVKPENILLDMTGHLKLADFGSSARLVNGKSVVCKMPVGTPEYIAPEVLMSMNIGGGVYGCECDWWSVGVVAFEMLCGCLPFQSDGGMVKLYGMIMNFKKNLQIPEEISLSDAAKGLITGLLEDQKLRMDYTKLATHEFFQSLDLTTLKSVRPPFIPELKDKCDTSHFEDFNPTKGRTKVPPTPTLANTVPFIGFSFTQTVYQSIMADSKQKAGRSVSISSTIDPDTDKSLSEALREANKQKTINEHLTTSLEAAKKSICEYEKKIKLVEVENRGFTEEINSKTESLNQMSQKLVQSQSDYEKLKKEFENINKNSENLSGLKSSLEAMKIELATEKQSVSQLSSEKSIQEKKVKDLEQDIDKLTRQIADLNSSLKNYEEFESKKLEDSKSSIAELRDMLEKKAKEYNDNIKFYKDESLKYREMVQASEARILALEKEKKNTDDKISSLTSNNTVDVDSISTNLKALTEENSVLKASISEEHLKLDEFKAKIAALEEEVKLKQTEIDSKEVATLKLTQTIRSYETDINELIQKSKQDELQIKSLSDEIKSNTTQIQGLTQENIKLKADLDSNVDSFKNLKSDYEKHEKEIEISSKESAERIHFLEQELQNTNQQLSVNFSELESIKKRIAATTIMIGDQEEENVKLKNDVQKLNETIAAQKISNFNLSQEIEQLNVSNKNLIDENAELRSRIERNASAQKETIIKLEATVSQQTKLINFLNSGDSKKGKAMAVDMDKKGIATVASNTTRKGRDVDHQLELERMENLRLTNEIIKLRQEIASLKVGDNVSRRSGTILSISDDTSSHKPSEIREDKKLSPGVGSSHESALNSKDGENELSGAETHHNFQTEVCGYPKICPVCFMPITFGKSIIRCQACKIFCHPTCDGDLPHFKCLEVKNRPYIVDSIDTFYLNNAYKNFEDGTTLTLPLSGWLSIPEKIGHNKFGWEKKWVVLSEKCLLIYNKKDNDMEVINTVDFGSMSSPCKLHPAVHTSDIVFAATISSIPFVFGIEVPSTESQTVSNTQTLPSQLDDQSYRNTIIHLMVTTLSEKRMWIKAFEIALSGYILKESNSLSSNFFFDPTKITCVRSISPVNDDLILIATPEGLFLYSFSDKNISPCFQISFSCHQAMYSNDYLLGIVGEKHSLVRFQCDKSKKVSKISIKSCHLSFTNIFDINDCYSIFSMDVLSDGCQSIVIKLTEIIIIKSVSDFTNFQLYRIPCDSIPSSIIRIENSLFVCQENFYQIDLTSKKKTEFLDRNDTTLAFLIYGSTPNNNVPMAIFQLSRISSPEYLICSSEFGLVVDSKGRRALTGDIRWCQIPLSFNFYNNKLYVCYYDMVEVRGFFKGPENDINDCTISIIKYLNAPRIVGISQKSEFAFVVSTNTDFTTCVYKLSQDASLPTKRSTISHSFFNRTESSKDSSSPDTKTTTPRGHRLFGFRKGGK